MFPWSTGECGGIHLLGLISEADHLVVIDAVCGNSVPGTLHRIEGEEIPERIRRKNSLHQLDFLEAMTCCHHGMNRIPETVILGVEPQSLAAYSDELTPLIQARVPEMVQRVLDEVLRLGGYYRPKRGVVSDAPCKSFSAP